MADIVSTKKRSKMMAGIKSKNTKPELVIRKALHKIGYRYSLHNKSLHGNPDICLTKYRTVIFVNGCFWHAHENCHLYRLPKSKTEFWQKKLSGNKVRDKKNIDKLHNDDWRVIVIWECSLKGRHKLDLNALTKEIDCWIQGDSYWLEIRGSKSTNQESHYPK